MTPSYNEKASLADTQDKCRPCISANNAFFVPPLGTKVPNGDNITITVRE